VGLEPARPRRATGSQARLRLKACALIHSAYGMVRRVSDHYPGVFLRRQLRSAHLIRSILKCLTRAVDSDLILACHQSIYAAKRTWDRRPYKQLHFNKRCFNTFGPKNRNRHSVIISVGKAISIIFFGFHLRDRLGDCNNLM